MGFIFVYVKAGKPMQCFYFKGWGDHLDFIQLMYVLLYCNIAVGRRTGSDTHYSKGFFRLPEIWMLSLKWDLNEFGQLVWAAIINFKRANLWFVRKEELLYAWKKLFTPLTLSEQWNYNILHPILSKYLITLWSAAPFNVIHCKCILACTVFVVLCLGCGHLLYFLMFFVI